eukprot:CAMPEP_0177661370 /NCGR_PEP_ID=MMETSP0447-20121125/18641_1 /TAXON_ID=0 /ORGANISM="Stygamoeba regulata, Strain BSH-02190019" /LENGTH=229 /DNA_ID=CAMNT_0019166705 /DNA_START=77 /DNA_END=766 /DNA_ORIENTATION=-
MKNQKPWSSEKMKKRKEETSDEEEEEKEIEEEDEEVDSNEEEDSDAVSDVKCKKPQVLKRKKGAPLEMKIPKRPVRTAPPSSKKKCVDPRFLDMCGEFHPDMFSKAYAFVDDVKQRECDRLRAALKNPRIGKQKKEEIAKALSITTAQIKSQQQKAQAQERKRKFRKEEAERVAQGKRPFYLSKVGEKKLALVEKYDDLQKKGQLDNFLAKRRKRQSQKEKKFLPAERR